MNYSNEKYMNECPIKSPFSLLSLQHVIVMNEWRGSKRMNAGTAPPPRD